MRLVIEYSIRIASHCISFILQNMFLDNRKFVDKSEFRILKFMLKPVAYNSHKRFPCPVSGKALWMAVVCCRRFSISRRVN